MTGIDGQGPLACPVALIAHEPDGLHTLLGFVACGLGVGIGHTGINHGY
ncbi:hypothetical protein OHT93_34055 [Streptomyces sp. NBC_00191]